MPPEIEPRLLDAIVRRLAKVGCSCPPDLANELWTGSVVRPADVLKGLEKLEKDGKVRKAKVQPARAKTPFHIVYELA